MPNQLLILVFMEIVSSTHRAVLRGVFPANCMAIVVTNDTTKTAVHRNQGTKPDKTKLTRFRHLPRIPYNRNNKTKHILDWCSNLSQSQPVARKLASSTRMGYKAASTLKLQSVTFHMLKYQNLSILCYCNLP